MKTHFLVYKIKNLITGHQYVGVHKTTNKKDSYMGSGPEIKAAILQYGLSNFKKTIIKICKSEEEMYEYEKKIITKDFISRADVLNCNLGGRGSFYASNFRYNPNRGFARLAKENPERHKEISRKGYLAGIGNQQCA